MNIRNVILADAKAICKIYNYYIENSVVTFETVPVSETDMKKRITEIIDSGLPYFVGEVDREIVGYCYIHKWHLKEAYSQTKEITIYMDINQNNKGYGTTLYQHLINHIDKTNTHVLLAVICIPNEQSVRLHEKFGFIQISCMKEVGWKFNEWRDVGHWQLIFK